MRNYVACLSPVLNRGVPPVAFLDELVDWALQAPDEIFARNERRDIYVSVVEQLGPWTSDRNRRAAMLEVLRVLGGFESSWHWTAGRDITNPASSTACTEEAGIFQCSGDSMAFDPSLHQLLLNSGGDGSCDSFRARTKADHRFAVEYCARLLRFTTTHHGPILHHDLHAWIRRDAVAEFESFL